MDESEAARSPLWRWLRISVVSIVLVFLAGVAAGFTAAHLERGGGLSFRFAGIIGIIVLLILACLWQIFRDARRPKGEAPLTAKERLNRNVLVASGLTGAAVAAAILFLGGQPLKEANIFSNDPLPTGLAVVLVLVLGVFMPIVSLYWQRHAVDEQEVDAYKTGALWALYVYMIGAPVWWFSWRGGFAPQPDGVIIFFATIFTMLIVWKVKKYGIS